MCQRYPIHRQLRRLPVLPAFLLLLGGCGSNELSLTAPLPTAGPLQVDAYSTASQPGPDGVRVQVRFRVTAGSLASAAQSGRARARLCLEGVCVDAPVSHGAHEGACTGAATTSAAGTRVGLAAAWADASGGGVDFCVADLSTRRVFDITLASNGVRSNVIRTICVEGGPCGSN